MARITSPAGNTSVVKNLGWFLKKARKTAIKSIVLTHVEHSYVMEAVFDDNWIYVTPYADLSMFKRVIGRQRSLKGQMVALIDKGSVHEFTL